MSGAAEPIGSATFENLLPTLVSIVRAVNNDNASLTPLQHKQAVAQAATQFRDQLNQAKQAIEQLAGGEMLPSDQDQVIAMLEALRDYKKAQLAQFAAAQPTLDPSSSILTDAMDTDAHL